MKCLFRYILLSAIMLFAHLHGMAQTVEVGTRGVAEGNAVYSIAQDSEGMMWLGTREGLISYDGYETRAYGMPKLGRILQVCACSDTLFVDCERGTAPLLIDKARYAGSRELRRECRAEWALQQYGRLVTAQADIDGITAYIGTGDSLLVMEKATGKAIRGWAMPVVKTLLRNDSLLFVGTDDGLFVLCHDGRMTRHTHDALFPETSLAGDVVWCLFCDRDGNIWIGTDNGVSMIERKPLIAWLSIPKLTGMRHGNNIDNVMRDSRGRLWLGGTNGLICVEQERQTYRWYRMGDERYKIPHNRIHRVYEDRQRRIWVCCDGGLLNYDEQSGQLNSVGSVNRHPAWTYDIGEDSAGQLLVVMSDSTYTLDAKTLAIVERQKAKRLRPSAKKHKTEVFYGTDRVGFGDAKAIESAKRGRPLSLTSVKAGERYVSTDTVRMGCVEVPFNENNLVVTFSDFDYRAEHLAQYYYRTGDGSWQSIDVGYNKVSLANLPYGTHRLEISSAGGEGVALTIRILPPWYLSWPMLTLYVLLFVALIIVIIIYFVQRKTLRLEREQREVMLANAKRKESELRQELMTAVQNTDLKEQSSGTSEDDSLLLKITKFIEDNMDNPDLSPSMLSDHTGVNQKQVYRKLKQLTGMTTVEYIRHLRLTHAAWLLRHGAFTVAEVMYSVGFTNASYFSRAFAAAHGMTPSEYKKS